MFNTYIQLEIPNEITLLFGLGYEKSEGNVPSLFLNSIYRNYYGAVVPPEPFVLLSKSNTRLKRNVFDNGFRLTPFPEGTR